jgi:phenylacetate-CoA ligase
MGLVNIIAHWYKILKILRSDKDELAKTQQRRLWRLIHYAANNSEFYQDLYKGIDLQNCNLQDLPTVTKAAMMDNYDRLVTDKRLKLHEIQNWTKDQQNVGRLYLGEFSPCYTSGSTGQNALITYHRKAVEAIQASLMANYPFQPKRSIYGHIQKKAGYLFGKRPRVAIVTNPNGNVVPILKRVSRLHRLFVNMKIFSYMDPLDQNVKELNKFRPDQLISAAFYIAQLAQEQLAGRLHLAFNHPVAYIASFGEILTGHTRALASKAWNMKIHDLYGAMECIHVATSCSASSRLHLMNHLCVLEVVDGNNRPVPQDQYGEKILFRKGEIIYVRPKYVIGH